MTYNYKGKAFESVIELAKVMYQDSEFFSRELRTEAMLSFIEEEDSRKAEKIRRLSPLSYPDDVFVFLASYVLNPFMPFRLGGYLFQSYKEIGETMLSFSPNMSNVLLQIVSYQLLSKHMHSTLYELDHPKIYQGVLEIERKADRDRERAYFAMAYFLSGKKTIIYKGVEYKDIYNLTHYLMQKERDIEALGTYLSTSPLLEAYMDYSDQRQELDVYFHVIQSYNKDHGNLQRFLKREREKGRFGKLRP